MTKIGNELHEDSLKERIKEFEKKGFRMINLGGKSPDAIGVKQGGKDILLVAIDVVSAYTKKPGAKQSYFCKQKQSLYKGLGFDDVFIFEYFKPIEPKKEVVRY